MERRGPVTGPYRLQDRNGRHAAFLALFVIPGRRDSVECGIHIHRLWLWIPGPRLSRRVPE